MSLHLRRKILHELTSQRGRRGSSSIRRARENWVKDYFDSGQIRLNRVNWGDTYSRAVSRVEGRPEGGVRSLSPRPITTAEWTNIHKYVNTELRKQVNQEFVFIQDIKKVGDIITIVYRRGPKRFGSRTQGTIDIEKHITDALRRTMDSFFKTGIFEKLIENSIIESKGDQETGMTASHGDTTEPFFGSLGTDTRAMPQADIERSLTGGAQTAPGAKGTLISKQMIAAIAKEAKETFNTSQFFTTMLETINAKWDDMFGYSTNVTSKDSTTQVSSQVQLTAELIPTRILRLQRLNRGVFDKAIKEELIRFLNDEQYFAEEILRLKPGIANQVEQLTTGSATARKRMEEAAIKLAETEILENLQKRSIRSKKTSKRKKKRGSSKTQYRGTGSSTRKQTTKRASTKRGRPSKATQAIRGNPIALKELINAQLPQKLLKEMQLPRLRNRTGRFRQSAEVTNVLMGPRGGTHIEYTYMKNPYQTFEPGGRQGSTSRDPRRLIGGTVREIAQEIMGRKFIKVRSV